MKRFILIYLLFLSTTSFAYNVDPATRTHKSNTDICWNIRDIIDDYVNFDYLNKNIEMRQQMYDELAAYINTLNMVQVDFISSDVGSNNDVPLEVTKQAVENAALADN